MNYVDYNIEHFSDNDYGYNINDMCPKLSDFHNEKPENMKQEYIESYSDLQSNSNKNVHNTMKKTTVKNNIDSNDTALHKDNGRTIESSPNKIEGFYDGNVVEYNMLDSSKFNIKGQGRRKA